jgi:hypothetical protein
MTRSVILGRNKILLEAVKGTGISWKNVNGWNSWKYQKTKCGMWEKIGKWPPIINQNLKNVPSAGYAIAANFSVVQMYFDVP